MLHTHYDDGVLLAYLDGALDEAEREDVSEHVARCAACHGQLTRLGDQSARLAGWFAREDGIPLDTGEAAPEGRSPSADAPRAASRGPDTAAVPPRRPHRGLRAAAAVTLLLGASALTPLGARVVGWIFRGASAPVERATPPVPSGQNEIVLEAAGDDFVIDLGAGTPLDRLTVTVDRVPRAKVVVTDGDGSESVVVGRGRVALGSSVASRARFEVVLPEHVTGVNVLSGGVRVAPAWAPGPAAVPRSWRVGG